MRLDARPDHPGHRVANDVGVETVGGLRDRHVNRGEPRSIAGTLGPLVDVGGDADDLQRAGIGGGGSSEV